MSNKLVGSPSTRGQIRTSIQALIDKEDYSQAAHLCEKLIQGSPENKELYWYHGLVLMLQEQEEEAQMTWMFAAADGEPHEIEIWTEQLVKILLDSARQQFQKENFKMAWAIRRHVREFSPNNVNNLLHLLKTSIILKHSFSDSLTELEVNEVLSSKSDFSQSEKALLLEIIELGLDNHSFDTTICTFSEICFSNADNITDVAAKLLTAGSEYLKKLDYQSSIDVGELLLRFVPKDLEILGHVATWHSAIHQFDKEIELTEKRMALSKRWIERVFSSFMYLKALMGAGGYWEKAHQVSVSHAKLIRALEHGSLKPETKPYEVLRLATITFFFPYFQDEPKTNREIHNLVGRFFSANMRLPKQKRLDSFSLHQRAPKPRRKLRIGYISHCFSQHSVGYLARWLIKSHDREKFEIYGYVIFQKDYDPLQQWYKQQFDQVCRVGIDCPEEGEYIAQQIYDDKIDILIDLDSITLDLTCEVMAYRPAPVQVTWLGWDASGIPEVDYYLADPYVLPKNAQEYYLEKIWRLPNTYLAIDGFEVDVPDISRQSLNIPDDAIIYMTAQKGFKRHPDTVHSQMEILRQVPNSYLLIKGPAEQGAIQQYFMKIAKGHNVAEEQLRFLPQTLLPQTHRANLKVADVVLDTFPYNGATTTMETLWMEVPMVTRVGKQFAARNSYTMMLNAGIEEGIAWTAEEYVEWGIRLGTDSQLRKDVAWKLRESKKHAPLWNTKAFTEEVESAYQQMWNIYVESLSSQNLLPS